MINIKDRSVEFFALDIYFLGTMDQVSRQIPELLGRRRRRRRHLETQVDKNGDWDIVSIEVWSGEPFLEKC